MIKIKTALFIIALFASLAPIHSHAEEAQAPTQTEIKALIKIFEGLREKALATVARADEALAELRQKQAGSVPQDKVKQEGQEPPKDSLFEAVKDYEATINALGDQKEGDSE